MTELPDEMDACSALSLAVLRSSAICRLSSLDQLEEAFGIN